MHINSQLAMYYVTVVISDAGNIDILVCNYCEAKISQSSPLSYYINVSNCL